MLRKWFVMTIAILLCLPMAGCYDRVELEGMAFILSLGMDKGPDNTLDVTARIAVPSELAGEGGGGGGGGGSKGGGAVAGSKPITVRAHTLPEAFSIMNTAVERKVSLLHLSSILISKELAEEGLLQHLRPLLRSREIRRTVMILVAPEGAKKTFMANDPVLEKSLSRWNASVADLGTYTGLFPRQPLHEFFVTMEHEDKDAIAPIVSINQKVKEKEKMGEEETNPSFTPGQLAREGGNPLEFLGTAVFKEDKMVTVLDGIESRMLLSIQGELQRTVMDFSDPLNEGMYVAVELKHARSPDIQVNLNATPIKVTVKEQLEGDLIGVQSATDYSRVEKIKVLEDAIRDRLKQRQEDLIRRMFHEYQVDPFGIFQTARSQFLTSDQLYAHDFRKNMKDAQIQVDVDFKLRRTGILGEPVQE